MTREKSAILIQRSVRQYLEKVRYIYTSVVPRILDAANRRIAARKRFVLARRLEPYVLKYISRKRTLRRESAASKIQSHWLKYKYMVKYQQLRESVIAIQVRLWMNALLFVYAKKVVVNMSSSIIVT